ncbi:MAG: hypothetical protein Q4A60_08850 [Pasteurellaceae bacterium]|nr:hypothetical protein [Pasteurellaceae bacterium]
MKKSTLTALAGALAMATAVQAHTEVKPKKGEVCVEMKEGKCVKVKAKTAEGKCGEGKCGGNDAKMKGAEGKCGEGKCGGHDTKMKGSEGKCGEGKCGGSK